jgi:hypothetical protein
VCPFCYQRNQFPSQYVDISETKLPNELVPSCSTIEYALPLRQTLVPPIFLFVVDTCLQEAELQALKDSLLTSLTLLPERSLVGLTTFGATVQIHELAFGECPKSYVFRGQKEVASKQIQELISLVTKPTGAGGAQQAPSSQQQQQQPFRENGFLVPLADCELTITSILEELQHDPHPVKSDRRPIRATGVALSAAVGLLEVCLFAFCLFVCLFVSLLSMRVVDHQKHYESSSCVQENHSTCYALCNMSNFIVAWVQPLLSLSIYQSISPSLPPSLSLAPPSCFLFDCYLINSRVTFHHLEYLPWCRSTYSVIYWRSSYRRSRNGSW